MNTKEKYGIVLLLVSILLFQIWVADAETQLNKEKKLSDNPLVIRTMDKIVKDDDLRTTAGFTPKKNDETVAKDDVSSIEKKEIKKTTEAAGFTWYKPWTWFS